MIRPGRDPRSRRRLLIPLLLLGLAEALPPASASDWRWLSSPTGGSDPRLLELHEEILGPRLDEAGGIPVKDARWSAESFEIHLRSGTLYPERPVQGSPTGALFVGDAEVRFQPDSRKARQDLERWFGEGGFGVRRTGVLLFHTLRGASMAEQLGLSGTPSVPLEDLETYREAKAALRQLGFATLHGFLNRNGRSRGAAYVLFPLPETRIAGSADAWLLYSFDPARRHQVNLAIAGHREVEERMPHKMFFRSLAFCHASSGGAVPPVRAREYGVELSVGMKKFSSEQTTSVTFTPSEGVSALRVALTPRMEVTSVAAGGKPLPFVQWQWLQADPNYDPYVIVDTGSLPAGEEQRINMVSSGSLFEPWLTLHWLAAEDDWLPILDDPSRSTFDIRFTVPGSRTAVAAGDLLELSEGDDALRYHFRTPRPFKRATIYFGDYRVESLDAGPTSLEAYVARSDVQGLQSLGALLEDVAAMLSLFRELFGELDTPVLRVTGTPTAHGRGFEGLILLGSRAGFSAGAAGDFFRAHEVAHQWWGNVVQPRDWPEDRWLSESFAEYAAMEFFDRHVGRPERTRQQIYRDWVMPVLESRTESWTNLVGDKTREPTGRRFALVDGQDEVYTRGPLLLHSLRYLFRVSTGDDDVFWEMLRTFLDRHRFDDAASADFLALAEATLGEDLGWFWDQWLWGRAIPKVRWSHAVSQDAQGWRLRVQAEQLGTTYRLLLPVVARLSGGEVRSWALPLEGASGSLDVHLPERPRDVTLNEGWEALIDLER